jgi:RecJ-like exonuclease
MKCRKCNGTGEIVVYKEKILKDTYFKNKMRALKTKAPYEGFIACPFCNGTGELE